MPEQRYLVFSIVIAGLFALTMLGFAVIRTRTLAMRSRRDFAVNYRSKFIEWGNGRGVDASAYSWLTRNGPRIQDEMGGYGIFRSFRPPYANYMFHNYPIVLNLLPELRRYLDDINNGSRLFGETADSYGRAIDEALLRYIGALDHEIHLGSKSNANPFIWFRVGVEQVLMVPFMTLLSFGLIGKGVVSAIERSIVFRLITAFVGLTTFVSSVVTVIVGWDQTKTFIISALKSLHQP